MKSIIILLLFCLSCSSNKSNYDNACNENLTFKHEFFRNIQNIEDQITKEKTESFDNSLNFIAKYAHVSFESMANYARTYPYGVFLEDKQGWLRWYEENKCNNIQFKE